MVQPNATTINNSLIIKVIKQQLNEHVRAQAVKRSHQIVFKSDMKTSTKG
jgi:hypothetical protein